MKAFTTFGVGATAADAFARPMQPLPTGITEVHEVSVPEGANPSKLGTWIQRTALDGGGAASAEVPADMALLVSHAAALLEGPNMALAISMAGNAAGDKMRVRLGAVDGEQAYLLFGLTAG